MTGGDILVSGGNVLGRWTRSLANTSELALQIYYDYTHRDQPGVFKDNLHTVDIDLQHYCLSGKKARITWGVGYRFWEDNVGNTDVLAFLPAELFSDLISGFAQIDYSLTPDVDVTLGSKFEYHSFSGFEYQPSLRIGYAFNPGMRLWGAVSRAVRAPSRIDRDFYAPGQPPYQLAGGPGFISEELLAYEVGYNARLSARSRFAIAAFYNVYDNLRSVEPGPPLIIMNGLDGETYGVEVSVEWEPLTRWMLIAGWNYFRKDIRLKPWSMDVNMGQGEGNDPYHRAHLTSRMDLSSDLYLDAHLRFVGELMNTNAVVPAYAELDVTLGWSFRPDFSVQITGNDLLHDEHAEFGSPTTRSLIERGFRAMLVWEPGR
jgi:iron complex outermembrane receptor protein